MTKDSKAAPQVWLAFIATLPVEDPASRMRVLRTLENMGCAVLRDGVYLLPAAPAKLQALQKLAEHVVRLNGTADLLRLEPLDEAQGQKLRSYFDRSAKYAELVKTVESIKSGFGIAEPGAIARVLAKQRREFETISALDFFPSEARRRAENALREAESRAHALLFPPPSSAGGSAAPAQYAGRVWATRKPLSAGRLACGWLIRRFIDPEARLVWLEKTEPCPADTVGYAFEGAEFANSASSLTAFEDLLRRFKLQQNAALARLAQLVHCLETGSKPVAEAAGVETLLQGARRRSNSEQELFAETEKTFDLLYDAYSD